ncbi:MAG: N-acetylmuramoyl-L-alanine amidase [bacterium]
MANGRKVKKIILHCSDSAYGEKKYLTDLHRQRGIDEVGYHFIILNGYLKPTGDYIPKMDGQMQPGRSILVPGNHCLGHNEDSIGVCLIGRHLFSARQLLETLQDLLVELMLQFDLEPKDIYGHYELEEGKNCPITCPNINMDMIRRLFV